MIRHTGKTATLLPVPLLIALLGAAFCVWSAYGNALNVCFTTGCSLYQDVTLAGISLWWGGVGAFALLGLLAMTGRLWLGIFVAGLCLFVDVLLLLLMMLTAPCVACLVVALPFALCYLTFRQIAARRDVRVGRSVLLYIWSVLFIINIGAVIRAETGTWAMHGPQDATVRVYFSPSCKPCRETVTALSGRPNVAFYPVAENDADIGSILAMKLALNKGVTMGEALSAKPVILKSFLSHGTPDMLMLRFHLLCNKAHVLASGSQSLPFVEYQGMPSGLTPRPSLHPTGPQPPDVKDAKDVNARDAALPIDGDVAGSCGGATPCP